MNDEQIDDRVIARVRSALDEVAAGADEDGLIPFHPRRELPRRWLGIAAATLLLAGGAGFTLSRRSAHDPAAAPDESTTTTVSTATTTSAVAGTTTPWFRIDTPGLIGGEIVTSPARPLAEQDLFQSWKFDDGGTVGYVTALIRSSQIDQPEAFETL